MLYIIHSLLIDQPFISQQFPKNIGGSFKILPILKNNFKNYNQICDENSEERKSSSQWQMDSSLAQSIYDGNREVWKKLGRSPKKSQNSKFSSSKIPCPKSFLEHVQG